MIGETGISGVLQGCFTRRKVLSLRVDQGRTVTGQSWGADRGAPAEGALSLQGPRWQQVERGHHAPAAGFPGDQEPHPFITELAWALRAACCVLCPTLGHHKSQASQTRDEVRTCFLTLDSCARVWTV
jgi:hypothetical protein